MVNFLVGYSVILSYDTNKYIDRGERDNPGLGQKHTSNVDPFHVFACGLFDCIFQGEPFFLLISACREISSRTA